MPASFSDLKTALTDLGLRKSLVLVHASDALDAETLLNALLETTRGIITPTFTYKSVLETNSPKDVAQAEAFHPDLPTDESLGKFPESLRKYPTAKRSAHPILSFAGIQTEAVLQTQTTYDPFAPIEALANQDGFVLLAGADHRADFSIHYGEKLAGRMQFIRWALTQNGIVECPSCPGDAEGFGVIAPFLEKYTRRVDVDGVYLQAIPLKEILQVAVKKIHEDPYAFLCGRPECELCEAVRWG